MSIYDRPYWQDQNGGSGGRGPVRQMGGMGMAFPKPTPAVKLLLIINVAVFLLQVFADRNMAMSRLLGVTQAQWWQVWRYVTFQFLHAGPMHILLNMLGVYFLGTALERSWGSAKFLRFYLGCGAVAGLAYVGIGALTDCDPNIPIIGASGGVYAILLACAVFFPQFNLILFLFPVPIRLAACLIFGIMIFVVLTALAGKGSSEAMSDVAHLGGAAAAAIYIWVLPKLGIKVNQAREESRKGAWKKKVKHQQDFDRQIDEILEKIQKGGIGSVSAKEQKLLKEATKRQREKDKEMRRM